jgi:hypothetical protein
MVAIFKLASEELQALQYRSAEEEADLAIARRNLARMESHRVHYEERVFENAMAKIGCCKQKQWSLQEIHEKIMVLGDSRGWNERVAKMFQCVVDIAELHGLDGEVDWRPNRMNESIEQFKMILAMFELGLAAFMRRGEEREEESGSL